MPSNSQKAEYLIPIFIGELLEPGQDVCKGFGNERYLVQHDLS